MKSFSCKVSNIIQAEVETFESVFFFDDRIVIWDDFADSHQDEVFGESDEILAKDRPET